MNINIEDLYKIIAERLRAKKHSYTNNLLKLGPKKMAQKFGERSTELIVDYCLVQKTHD